MAHSQELEARRREAVSASPVLPDALELPAAVCVVPRLHATTDPAPDWLRTLVHADATARFLRARGMTTCLPITFDHLNPEFLDAARARGMPAADYLAEAMRSIGAAVRALGVAADGNAVTPSGDARLLAANQSLFVDMWKDKLVYRRLHLGEQECSGCQRPLTLLTPAENRCIHCGRDVKWSHTGPWLFRSGRLADDVLKATKSARWSAVMRHEQQQLVGRLPGIEITCKIGNRFQGEYEDVAVFVDRPEYLLAMEFLCVRADHPALASLVDGFFRAEYLEYRDKIIATPLRFRNDPRLGAVLTGIHVINPITLEQLPVLAAAHIPPGHDALIGVPAYVPFDRQIAKPHHLRGRASFGPAGPDGPKLEALCQTFGRYQGLTVRAIRDAITEHLVERTFARRMVRHHARSAVCATETMPGVPVPIYHCEKCGEQAAPSIPCIPGRTTPPPSDAWTGDNAGGVTCPACGASLGGKWYAIDWRTDLVDPLLAVLSRPAHGEGRLTVHAFLPQREQAYRFLTARAIAHFLAQAHPCIEENPFRAADAIGRTATAQKIEALAAQWGIDAVRVVLLTAGAPAESVTIGEAALRGAHRSLLRVLRAFERSCTPDAPVSPERADSRLAMAWRVARELEQGRFHSAWARLMQFTRTVVRGGAPVDADTWRAIAQCLFPFAPHHAAELYERAGGQGLPAKWPDVPEHLPHGAHIEIAVFMDGKRCGRFSCPAGTPKTDLGRLALGTKKVKDLLGRRRVKLIFTVEDYLVNIVPCAEEPPESADKVGAPAAAPAQGLAPTPATPQASATPTPPASAPSQGPAPQSQIPAAPQTPAPPAQPQGPVSQSAPTPTPAAPKVPAPTAQPAPSAAAPRTPATPPAPGPATPASPAPPAPSESAPTPARTQGPTPQSPPPTTR